MINTKEVQRVNFDIDRLVNILSAIVNTQKEPIVNFTKDELHEFLPLFVSNNFTDVLKKKALSSNIVAITEFKEADFILAILSLKNFLQLEKLPIFNATYSVTEEERSNIRKAELTNKMKFN